MSGKDKLPEEFAPTGPKLSRFAIRPAPPVRPRLFPDEARFALRLALLAGATEFAVWAWLAAQHRRREVVALAALRLLKPVWAWLGTHLPRPAVAFALLFAALFGAGASLLTLGQFLPLAIVLVGLPALADLCASCIGDRVTVERRAAAYAWLDMAQGAGGAAGAALGAAFGGFALVCAAAALLLGSIALPDLGDRGTPRSTWPIASYVAALGTPIGAQLPALALACGLLAAPGRPVAPPWVELILPLAGMALAARAEPRMPNAIWLPRIAVLLAAGGFLFEPLRPFALGAMFAAIPAAVARGAGEMERPLISSLAWTALLAGAAIRAVL